MHNLKKIADSNNTVLITGRTGTGKSHLAKEIHRQSPRRNQKYLAINLTTLSENLIESELFGHERGAFSGADTKRIGKLECANGGTVFLDEIGELSLRMQTKLLESLNSYTISPVGSNREIQLDIRVIAATNKDLPKMVAAGEFREDLYFRINTFQIQLASLKEEREKIPSLAKAFCEEAALKQNRNILGYSESFFEELKSYGWPGNIRELKNAMEFAVAMTNNGWISPDLLPPASRKKSEQNSFFQEHISHLPLDYREAKGIFERLYLREALQRNEGRINITARKAGLSKVTLIEKIRKYEINVQEIKYHSFANARRAEA